MSVVHSSQSPTVGLAGGNSRGRPDFGVMLEHPHRWLAAQTNHPHHPISVQGGHIDNNSAALTYDYDDASRFTHH
jgi:hypothetical protein